VQSAVEQLAIEEAPKILDPVQQTIITVLRGYINNPAFSRKEIIGYMQKLSEPQPSTYVKTLRRAYDAFTGSGRIEELIAGVKSIMAEMSSSNSSSSSSEGGTATASAGGNTAATSTTPAVAAFASAPQPLSDGGGSDLKLVKEEDLRLICFSYLSSS
jgi:hypothetical protein